MQVTHISGIAINESQGLIVLQCDYGNSLAFFSLFTLDTIGYLNIGKILTGLMPD